MDKNDSGILWGMGDKVANRWRAHDKREDCRERRVISMNKSSSKVVETIRLGYRQLEIAVLAVLVRI